MFAIWQVVGVATTTVTMATAGLFFGITSIIQNGVSLQPVDITEQIKGLFLLEKGGSIQWTGIDYIEIKQSDEKLIFLYFSPLKYVYLGKRFL